MAASQSCRNPSRPSRTYNDTTGPPRFSTLKLASYSTNPKITSRPRYPQNATSHFVIARIGHALSWLFDRFEADIDSNYKWNYLKFTFVNLEPLEYGDKDSGQMTTNAPQLPSPSGQPPQMMIHQIVTTMRMFFSHLRGSVEISDWESDLYSCDWVPMTFNKA